MQAIVMCDIVDAASYLGAVRFERAAAMFSILSGEQVDISYRPAQAVEPGLSPEQAEAAARISGIDFNFAELVAADSSNAWRLLLWAFTEDRRPDRDEAVQRNLIHQLWRAHFLEGADIADPLVLAGRAAVSGLPLETADALLASDEFSEVVESQRLTAAAVNATNLPFIVVDTHFTIAALQSQDVYLQALAQISAGEAEPSDSADAERNADD